VAGAARPGGRAAWPGGTADALAAEHAATGPLLAAIDAAAADPDYGYQRFGVIMIGGRAAALLRAG
jgi:hypothetical protein